jgi:hypothetical protein
LKRNETKGLDRPTPIAPQSVVRLAYADSRTPSWRRQIGRVFRIGYYSAKDGLDVISLVNEKGEYEQITDHEFLYRYFDVIYFARDTNWYGRRRSLLPPIRRADALHGSHRKVMKARPKKRRGC